MIMSIAPSVNSKGTDVRSDWVACRVPQDCMGRVLSTAHFCIVPCPQPGPFTTSVVPAYRSPSLECVLVRMVGLTAFAHYVRCKWTKSATAGIYREHLLIIIKFGKKWNKFNTFF